MSFYNIRELVAELWNANTEEEVIQILKEMSRISSPKVNLQKPINFEKSCDQLNQVSEDRKPMIVNCWINGVWKELDLNDLSTEFKKFNSKKIN